MLSAIGQCDAAIIGPMNTKPRIRRYLAFFLGGCLASAAAQAQHGGDHSGMRPEHDHERARHALDRGEVLPIAEILSRTADRVPGEVVEVEFERDDHRGRHWIYELKILAEDGRVLEVRVDAASGEILGMEED